ncbi:hypothetical protein [Dechloromonas denitrificans]|uniref:hypothetical protein n=1 Tax=Dechloromonas denitrificans TaxID=281362 RepID=UPI001CF8C57F|nr:hypothetical protein [Dechloromonas denitrificans]UCV02329.1 hypothetical protein KI611_14685 [Dechloromonas denitrificans]
MCFTVLPQRPVQQLVVAAQAIQQLIDDGTMTAAFVDAFSTPNQTNTVIAAFDRLQECTKALAGEHKQVSPFLRYRREIMDSTPAGAYLQRFVLSLYSGHPVPLRPMIERFGDHEMRIFLECIAHFLNHGDRDSQFMTIAMEIAEATAEVAA